MPSFKINAVIQYHGKYAHVYAQTPCMLKLVGKCYVILLCPNVLNTLWPREIATF